VSDRQVNEDGPQVSAVGVGAEDLVEHGAPSLRVAVLELQLGELGDQLHAWEERRRRRRRRRRRGGFR